jgi:hypothetical protein
MISALTLKEKEIINTNQSFQSLLEIHSNRAHRKIIVSILLKFLAFAVQHLEKIRVRQRIILE